jgi:NAD(P)-dependent dehydrogenase (short-subunit alcohol dehydrogenase family)
LLLYASIAISNHGNCLHLRPNRNHVRNPGPPDRSRRRFQNSARQPAQLHGKTLLVTGGASGFGEAIVTAFTKLPGTAAIVADNNSQRGQNLEHTFRETGCSVKFVQIDVTDWESGIGLFRCALSGLMQTYDEKRTIDHVVTCAGVIGGQMDFTPAHPDEFPN